MNKRRRKLSISKREKDTLWIKGTGVAVACPMSHIQCNTRCAWFGIDDQTKVDNGKFTCCKSHSIGIIEEE